MKLKEFPKKKFQTKVVSHTILNKKLSGRKFLFPIGVEIGRFQKMPIFEYFSFCSFIFEGQHRGKN